MSKIKKGDLRIAEYKDGMFYAERYMLISALKCDWVKIHKSSTLDGARMFIEMQEKEDERHRLSKIFVKVHPKKGPKKKKKVNKKLH